VRLDLVDQEIIIDKVIIQQGGYTVSFIYNAPPYQIFTPELLSVCCYI
jgi:hypothetical protein